jgi:hypothetical protein
MDLPNTIIGIVMFAILILPIVFINRKTIKKRNALVNKLHDFSNSKNKEIKEFDSWTDNSIVGISADNQTFFYLRNTINYNRVEEIELSNIKFCHFIQKKDLIGRMTKSLDLEIELRDSSKVVLEFFKADEKNFIMGEEMRIIKKWIEKINPEVSNKVLLYNI